jgi:outer membrane PBP1 activator LpoA protein
MLLLGMTSLRKYLTLILIALILAGCSANSDSNEEAQTSSNSNPLAELTFAENSSDAYKRACYWLKAGDNIFGFERIKEGNELARSEGKLPLLGVEQAMEKVFREGEPQAVEEHQVVKDFCRGIGYPID